MVAHACMLASFLAGMLISWLATVSGIPRGGPGRPWPSNPGKFG